MVLTGKNKIKNLKNKNRERGDGNGESEVAGYDITV